MAELTNLESKLGEVTGLAMAAQAATEKVLALAENEQETNLASALREMHKEAAETEQRCTELAGTFDGKKTAILDEARATKSKGAEMMKTYLDSDSDTLDGFEFLTMAEAGEVGHWSVLAAMNQRANHQDIESLVSWALPIQQRHLSDVMEVSVDLAANENPSETA
jgi:hypothetical protein